MSFCRLQKAEFGKYESVYVLFYSLFLFIYYGFIHYYKFFYSIILLENSNSETVGGLWRTLFDACSEWIAIVTEKQYLKT